MKNPYLEAMENHRDERMCPPASTVLDQLRIQAAQMRGKLSAAGRTPPVEPELKSMKSLAPGNNPLQRAFDTNEDIDALVAHITVMEATLGAQPSAAATVPSTITTSIKHVTSGNAKRDRITAEIAMLEKLKANFRGLTAECLASKIATKRAELAQEGAG